MRIRKWTRHALSTLTTLALLTGCEGNISQVASLPRTQSAPAAGQSVHVFDSGDYLRRLSGSDARTSGLIFASLPDSNTVDIFRQRGKSRMIEQITGLSHPLGLATDGANNLYIANQSAPTVPVYAPPYTGSPALTLDNTGYLPQEVAVSPTGVVAVSDFCDNSSCTSEYSIVFFAKGSTEPCAAVAIPSPDVVGKPGFDRQGDLFIGGQASNFDGFLGEIKGGCKAKRMIPLTTANSIGETYAIQIDKANDIAVLDFSSGQYIYTYHHPKHGSLGNPISTTTLDPGGCFTFAFLSSGKNLYANINLTGAYEFAYPAGGAAKKSILFDFHGDLAVSPPLIP